MSGNDDALQRALRDWTSQERHRRATASRIAATVQGQISTEESRFHGLLRDLAESNGRAQLQLADQKLVNGEIYAVGRDFVAVLLATTATVLVSTTSIIAVFIDVAPRKAPTPSSRTLDDLDMAIVDVLHELSVDSMRIRFTLRDETQMRSGEVFAVGSDMCTIGLGVPPEQTLFVPLERFETLSLG